MMYHIFGGLNLLLRVASTFTWYYLASQLAMTFAILAYIGWRALTRDKVDTAT